MVYLLFQHTSLRPFYILVSYHFILQMYELLSRLDLYFNKLQGTF